MKTKAYCVRRDGDLYYTGFSEIDGMLWCAGDEVDADSYTEFSSRDEAQEFIDWNELDDAEIIERDSLWE